VLSVAKAATRERENLVNALVVARSVDSKLESVAQDLLKSASSLTVKYEELCLELTASFDTALDAIQAQKEAVLQQLADQLSADQSVLSQAIVSTNVHSGQVAALIGDLRGLSGENDIELLLKSKERESRVKEVAVKVNGLASKKAAVFNKDKQLNEVLRLVKTAFMTHRTRPTSSADKDPVQTVATPRRVHRSSTIKNPRHKPRKSSPDTAKSTSDLLRQTANLQKYFGLTPVVSEASTPRNIKVNLDSGANPLWQEDLSTIMHVDDEDGFSAKSFDLGTFCSLDYSIWTLGGCDHTSLKSVECYRGAGWVPGKGLLAPRELFGAVVHEGVRLVMGGISVRYMQTKERSKSVEQWSGTSWTPSSLELPASVSGFGAVDCKTGLFIAGGSDGVPLNSAFIKGRNRWIPALNMKQRRDQFAMVVGPDSQVYALGGFGGRSM
jgi:hypothetical protein